MIGLGSYPVVTLAEARNKALENRRALAQGKDPRRSRAIPTFEQATEAVIAIRADTWRDGGRTAGIWRSSLGRFAYPQIGSKRVNEISSADVMRVLLPIWNDKRATATKLKSRIGGVMAWAIAQGHRTDNPAGDAIAAALPRTGTQQAHHRALPHQQVADAIATVQDSDASPATKLAFEYLVLTAARSGEVRGARWDEIDLDAQTWTVPGGRTKTGKPHRVPLSTRALEILADATTIADESGLLFPSPSGRKLSDATMSKLLKERNIGAVPTDSAAASAAGAPTPAYPAKSPKPHSDTSSPASKAPTNAATYWTDGGNSCTNGPTTPPPNAQNHKFPLIHSLAYNGWRVGSRVHRRVRRVVGRLDRRAAGSTRRPGDAARRGRTEPAAPRRRGDHLVTTRQHERTPRVEGRALRVLFAFDSAAPRHLAARRRQVGPMAGMAQLGDPPGRRTLRHPPRGTASRRASRR